MSEDNASINMRPGMACVLDVLRGEANRRPIALTEWQDAFQVAEHEMILPYFAARVRQSGEPLPSPIEDHLSHAEQQATRNSFWWASELRGILEAFSANAIPVIPLKGPMLADRIYGGVNLRQSSDIDLLVWSPHVGSANSVLEKLGFTSSSSPHPYHVSWQRGTTCVELHFDVVVQRDFNFDTAGAIKRATPREFLGQPVWQFAPSDELLFLCLHGMRHHFERLTHVLDIVLALKCLTPGIDPAAYEHGPAARLRPLIVLCRAMAMRLDPHCIPALDLRESPKTMARMEKLAEKRWMALLKGGTPFDLLDQQRFHLQTKAAAKGYLLHILQDISTHLSVPSQKDLDLAARFGVKQPALVLMLRQFRLLARLCGVRLATKRSGARTDSN